MSFSMPSYFLGVGTVVAALALGFGGGVVLTKTAIKETSVAPTRVERVARSEPLSNAAQVTEAAAVPVARAEPPATPSAAEPAPQLPAAVEPVKPVAEAPREEPARTVPREELPKAAEPVTRANAQAEQQEPEQWRSMREQRKAERDQRRMERRSERELRYAERKAKELEYVRMRQRPIDEQERPGRPDFAFEREEPRLSPIASPLEGLFGRPIEVAPAQRD